MSIVLSRVDLWRACEAAAVMFASQRTLGRRVLMLRPPAEPVAFIFDVILECVRVFSAA